LHLRFGLGLGSRRCLGLHLRLDLRSGLPLRCWVSLGLASRMPLCLGLWFDLVACEGLGLRFGLRLGAKFGLRLKVHFMDSFMARSMSVQGCLAG
jgi:hypothetical protein